MHIPVVLAKAVSFTKLNHSGDEFSVTQMFMVVEIKKNLVSSHIFEIDVVFKGYWLLVDSGTYICLFNGYFIGLATGARHVECKVTGHL